MSQSSQSQRERRQMAPQQAGQARTPEAPARQRRSSSSASETSQRFDPSQFDVSATGVVSIQKRRLPTKAASTLGIVGAYTGVTSPTVTVQDGAIVLVLATNDVIYPYWAVLGEAKLGSGGTLDLYFTAAGAAEVDITVDMYHSLNGVAIPATATTTKEKTVIITVAKESVLASFPISSGSAADVIRFKITATDVVSGNPGLHAAVVRYTPEHAHTHSEARS